MVRCCTRSSRAAWPSFLLGLVENSGISCEVRVCSRRVHRLGQFNRDDIPEFATPSRRMSRAAGRLATVYIVVGLDQGGIVLSPENGRPEVVAEQDFAARVAALEANRDGCAALGLGRHDQLVPAAARRACSSRPLRRFAAQPLDPAQLRADRRLAAGHGTNQPLGPTSKTATSAGRGAVCDRRRGGRSGYRSRRRVGASAGCGGDIHRRGTHSASARCGVGWRADRRRDAICWHALAR